MADARAIIEGLREEIRRLERKAPGRAAFVASGRQDVDALLPGGGFPRGALSELSGGPASGKTALALGALARAMGEEGLGAWVDGRGELYPPAAAALGVDLDRLLLVRPRAPAGAAGAAERARCGLWAAEAVLASGAFGTVVVDVALEDLRGVSASGLTGMLRRLRAAAEQGGTVGLWLSAPRAARIPAAVRLDVEAGAGGPAIRRAFGRGSVCAPAPQFFSAPAPQLPLPQLAAPEVGHAA